MAGQSQIPLYVPGDRGTIAQLLMAQGEAQARGAERSGQIWGNAVNQIGQLAGGAVQQYQEDKLLKRREAAIDSVMGSWDGQDAMQLYRGLAPIIGPEKAQHVAQGLAETRLAAEKLRRGEMPSREDTAGMIHTAGALEDAQPGYLSKPENYDLLKKVAGPGILAHFGVQMPDTYTPEVGQIVQTIYKQVLAQPKGAATKTVTVRQPDGSEVTKIVEDKPGQEFVSAPKPERPVNVPLEQQLAAAALSGDKATYDRLLKVKRDEAAAGHISEPRGAGGGSGLTPNQESMVIGRLTNQYQKATATVGELSRQVGLMNNGLAAARRGDLAAGSQAVLVTFQKILDPTSVVRESEYARSAAGQALLSRIQGATEKLIKGGAGVPLSELEKYSRLATEMTQGSLEHLKAETERIGKVADRYGIPKDLVIENYDYAAKLGGQQAAPEARRTATNPKTGQKIEWNGTAWIPVK